MICAVLRDTSRAVEAIVGDNDVGLRHSLRRTTQGNAMLQMAYRTAALLMPSPSRRWWREVAGVV